MKTIDLKRGSYERLSGPGSDFYNSVYLPGQYRPSWRKLQLDVFYFWRWQRWMEETHGCKVVGKQIFAVHGIGTHLEFANEEDYVRFLLSYS